MTIQQAYLRHLSFEGAARIFGDPVPQYVIERLNFEFDTIFPNDFTDYILTIWDVHDFCRSEQRVSEFCDMMNIARPDTGIIPLGPGRGSVGGSMVCYCIGIHECDPIVYGLYFERFLNPERIAPPDIDFDISQRYRHIVLAYIAWKYGADHVSQIITYNTMSGKTVVLDVLSAANVPEHMIQKVKDAIPGDPDLMFDDLLESQKFMDAMRAVVFPSAMITVTPSNVNKILTNEFMVNNDPVWLLQSGLEDVRAGKVASIDIEVPSSWDMDKALDRMARLFKLNKYESAHASGIVVSPVPLASNVPLMRKNKDGVLGSPCAQYDMVMLEKLGYLKLDALGLRTVDANWDTMHLINEQARLMQTNATLREMLGGKMDFVDIPTDDVGTFELIQRGDTIGIFQLESSGFTKMMVDMKANKFDDIIAGVALYRPGPLDAIIEGKTMVQHYIDRKLGKEQIIYMFPEEAEYLGSTYGIMVYQEQVMARVRHMTGCTYGRADMLRRAMGKKDEVKMRKEMDWFLEHAMQHDFTSRQMTPENKAQIVDRAIEEIKTFARYGFNKAHATEYAINTYRSAYFKAHHPLEFFVALLNSELGDSKRQTIILRDMIKHDIHPLAPDINLSQMYFTLDERVIRFGLSAVKGLGEKGTAILLAERDQYGPFKSFSDFRARVSAQAVNVAICENLIMAGGFDNLIKLPVTRGYLLKNCRPICEAISKIKAKKPKKEAPTREQYMPKVAGALQNVTFQPADEGVDNPIQYGKWEKTVLSYYLSAHPIDEFEAEMRRWTCIGDIEPEDLPKEVYIGGFVSEVHETVVKKEGRMQGRQMGFITIDGAFRAWEGTMFPDIYESCRPYLVSGAPVVMKAKKDFYKDAVSLQVMYIRNMMAKGIRDCPEAYIRADASDICSMIQLQGMFTEHPGITNIFIVFRSGRDNITIKIRNGVALNDRIINFVESVGWDLSYKPLQ